MEEPPFDDLPLSVIVKSEPDWWEGESTEHADITYEDLGDIKVKEEPLTLLVSDAFPRTIPSSTSQSPSSHTDQSSSSTMEHRKGKLYEVGIDSEDVDARFESLLNEFKWAAEEKQKKEFLCLACNFEAPSRYMLVRHKIAIHGEQKHACQRCQFTTGYLGELVKHQKRCHPPLECKQCRFTTYNERSLRKHEELHMETYVQCDKCNFKTRRRDALARHNMVRHTVDLSSRKCVSCERCPSKFVNLKGLRRHMTTKHGRSDVINEESEGSESPPALAQAIDAIYRKLFG